MGKSDTNKGSEKGQITLLVGLLVVLFLLLFALVVNVGMLVHAKINLQNAADLAAYAGASTQARQLNHISYLNYEMRRQFKKFLFRYYYIGNMAQASSPAGTGAPCAPAGVGGGSVRCWSPCGGLECVDYGLPSTCVIFNGQDNYCKVSVQAKIEVPNFPNPDPMMSALTDQLKKFEQIRQANCGAIGATNSQLLSYWLFNTDPRLDIIEQQLSQQGTTQNQGMMLKTLKTVAHGLGLYPREIILLQRITTLQDYVNYAAQTLDYSKAVSLEGLAGDTAARERPLQAFFSAYYTLSDRVFANNDLVLTELLPQGANGANLLKLKDLRTHFEAYYTDYPVDAGDAQAPADCRGVPIPVRVNNMPVGVAKDPSILTYYAVRLKAKAKILFSPFGDVELKAYASTQPFGSRIGPQDPAFVRSNYKSPATLNFPFPEPHGVPNLPIQPDDDLVHGWNQTAMLQALDTAFHAQGGDAGKFGVQELEAAYQIAMAPNPWEKGQYNIINDLGATDNLGTTGDPFQRFFWGGDTYSFWAPVLSPDKFSADAENAIAEMIDSAMGGENGQVGSYTPEQRQAFQVGFSAYLNTLRQGTGEGGEGFNVARLKNPFTYKNAQGSLVAITLPEGLIMDQSKDVRTSWNDVLNLDFDQRGRLGYSVKFVSFSTLLNPTGVTTDGTNTWTNPPVLDGEAAEDLNGGSAIQH